MTEHLISIAYGRTALAAKAGSGWLSLGRRAWSLPTQSGHPRNVRLPYSRQVQSIKRTDRLTGGLLHVGIDHGGLEIAVP